MKKTIALLMASILTFGGVSAYAAKDVTVMLDGEKMEFDVNPFIEDDRTLVPMRAIFEAVGAQITWEEGERTVIALQKKDSSFNSIAIQIDTEYAFVNSERKDLDVPARIVNNRTFVPLRFVMEELGAEVTWDSDSYTVNIKTK